MQPGNTKTSIKPHAAFGGIEMTESQRYRARGIPAQPSLPSKVAVSPFRYPLTRYVTFP